MSRADELVELIRGRIHSEFDGECHLTDTEAHAIADFLSETAAALDEREIASGLTSNGNLWRFWAQKAKDTAAKLSEGEQREKDARRVALEEAAKVANTEDELPGEPSKLVVAAMEAVGPVGNARSAVRTTKASIAKRIRALQSEER